MAQPPKSHGAITIIVPIDLEEGGGHDAYTIMEEEGLGI